MKSKDKKNGEKSGVVNYLVGVRQELKKVTWPTKDQLIKNTAVVLVVCIILGVFFWGIDTGFLALLQMVLGITLG